MKKGEEKRLGTVHWKAWRAEGACSLSESGEPMIFRLFFLSFSFVF